MDICRNWENMKKNMYQNGKNNKANKDKGKAVQISYKSTDKGLSLI